jgi:hypothetical protein
VIVVGKQFQSSVPVCRAVGIVRANHTIKSSNSLRNQTATVDRYVGEIVGTINQISFVVQKRKEEHTS